MNCKLNPGLAMKTNLTLLCAALLLTGCSAFNTVPLYRESAAYQTFLGDRLACVEEAGRCIAQKYADSHYDGEPVQQLFPSWRVYLGCMSARGYYPIANGFVPPVLVKMTDYRPGRDCFN